MTKNKQLSFCSLFARDFELFVVVILWICFVVSIYKVWAIRICIVYDLVIHMAHGVGHRSVIKKIHLVLCKLIS